MIYEKDKNYEQLNNDWKDALDKLSETADKYGKGYIVIPFSNSEKGYASDVKTPTLAYKLTKNEVGAALSMFLTAFIHSEKMTPQLANAFTESVSATALRALDLLKENADRKDKFDDKSMKLSNVMKNFLRDLNRDKKDSEKLGFFFMTFPNTDIEDYRAMNDLKDEEIDFCVATNLEKYNRLSMLIMAILHTCETYNMEVEDTMNNIYASVMTHRIDKLEHIKED